MTRAFRTAVIAALLITPTFSRSATAKEQQQQATVAVTQAVEMPGIVLQPGNYVFSVDAATGTRQTLSIRDTKTNRVVATVLAVPAQRSEGVSGELVPFGRTEGGNPSAIRFWFPPRQSSGFELVYPRDRAVVLARTGGTRVLSTDAVDASAVAGARVAAIDPRGQSQEYSDPVTVGRREAAPPPPPNVAPPSGGETAATTTSPGTMAPAPGAPSAAGTTPPEQRPVPEPTATGRREDPPSPTSTTSAPAPSTVAPESTAAAPAPSTVPSNAPPAAAAGSGNESASTPPVTTTAATAAAATQGAAAPTPQPGYTAQTAPAASDATRAPGATPPPSGAPAPARAGTAAAASPRPSPGDATTSFQRDQNMPAQPATRQPAAAGAGATGPGVESEGYRQGAATAPASAAPAPHAAPASPRSEGSSAGGVLPATATLDAFVALCGAVCVMLALLLWRRMTQIVG